MAIITTAPARFRTEVKTFTGSLGTLESDYATYEGTKATDTTKTWTVRVVSSYYDGTNFILVAEASYPERSDNPTGVVPEAP